MKKELNKIKFGLEKRNCELKKIYLLFLALFLPLIANAQTFPGGFIEPSSSTEVRPLLTLTQIQSLLPTIGRFTFPSPYSTEAIRLTNALDCNLPTDDCIYSLGYSYWRNSNNHVGSDIMYIFLGTRNRGPILISYNKVTDQVANLGPLFDSSSPFRGFSGEGWYFSGSMPTKMYITKQDSKLFRYDVLTRQLDEVFDSSIQFPNTYLWQIHSSDDDNVHSATLRDSNTYDMLGCVVYKENTQQLSFYPELGALDECNIDGSGRWLMILDNIDNLWDVDMRIVDLSTGNERIVMDQDGAVGHADMGYGYVVGDDNWGALPNMRYLWDFNNNPLSGILTYHGISWVTPAPNHISHMNRKPISASQQFVCGSGASSNNANRANEIICWQLDTSLDVLVVAPVMTDMNALGGGDSYEKQPKGNLDVTGNYFIWTTNMAGIRQDAFIVKVPSHLLNLGTATTVSTSTVVSTTTSTVPQPGLDPVGYWMLDESSGTIAIDSSTNANNGNLVNNPTRIAGNIGNAVSFDGVDDYINIQHSPILNSYPLTVSLWLKTSSTGVHGIVNKYLPASRNGWQIFTNNGNICAWYFSDASNYVWDGTGCTLATPGYNDNNWHHVVFTVDQTGGKLYIDSLFAASMIWTGTPGQASTTQDLNLGTYPSIETPYFPGSIDDVRVYDRVLSQQEISNLYAITTTTTSPTTSTTSSTTSTSSTSTTTTSIIPCTLRNPAWNFNVVNEGDLVELNVLASNCNGMQIDFDIYEDDAIGIDEPALINPQPSAITADSQTAQGIWTAEWQNDCAGACNPPEYYFNASISENPAIWITSMPDLSVNKMVITTTSTTSTSTTTTALGIQVGLTDTLTHAPLLTGLYPYSPPGIWLPGSAGFLLLGNSYIDPTFGTTIRRITDDYPSQSCSDIYVKNGLWNADSTLFMHRPPCAAGGLRAINADTGQIIRSSIPMGLPGEGSFDPVDPDVWYYLNGASIGKYSISTGVSSTLKTFPATIDSPGGSVDWIDRSGRYFMVKYNGALHVWDKQIDLIYTGSPAYDFGGGWAGISPNGEYVIAAGPGLDHRSFKIDHVAKTLSTSNTLFWSLCGDHSDVISPSDGKTYLVASECNTQAAVYRIDVTIPQAAAAGNADKQRADNLLLLDREWADNDGHFSCASKAPNQDWCVFSNEAGDDTFSSMGTWRPYKQEIIAVNVITREIRRLVHHRSRSIGLDYYYHPRPSFSWGGTKLAYSSNFGCSLARCSDTYVLDLGVGSPITTTSTISTTSSTSTTSTSTILTSTTTTSTSSTTSIIIQTPAIIAHWKLDELSGNAAIDSSGNNNPGTLLGNPSRVTGKIFSAIQFDGTDDYISVTHNSILNAYPITVTAWVKTSATDLRGIINKYYPSSWNGWQIFMNNGNICAWYFKDRDNNIWDGTGCSLAVPGYNDNSWHHIAFVADSSGGRLYVDSILKSSQPWTGIPGPTSTTQEISIARYPDAVTQYLPGTIDDVRIYNTALSQSEIALLYQPATTSTSSIQTTTSSTTTISGKRGRRIKDFFLR